MCADLRKGAQQSDASVGDTVLLRQDTTDKFSTTLSLTPHKIISKTGNKVLVEYPTRAQYVRNTTFVKKHEGLKSEEGETQGAKDTKINEAREREAMFVSDMHTVQGLNRVNTFMLVMILQREVHTLQDLLNSLSSKK